MATTYQLSDTIRLVSGLSCGSGVGRNYRLTGVGCGRRTGAGVGRWVEGEFARGTASGRGGRASAWVGGSAGAGCGQEIEGGISQSAPPTAIFADLCLCGCHALQPQKKSETNTLNAYSDPQRGSLSSKLGVYILGYTEVNPFGKAMTILPHPMSLPRLPSPFVAGA